MFTLSTLSRSSFNPSIFKKEKATFKTVLLLIVTSLSLACSKDV